MKIAVIGSGFYGCAVAIILSKKNQVDLYEKESNIFNGASSCNQFRYHSGYHYPRSQKTVNEIKKSKKDFMSFFTKNVFKKTINYYSVAKKSKVNFRKYSKFLKRNGIMYIATLNKTLKSYIFAIVGAEYILRWLPIGTHDWQKFIKPSELIGFAEHNSMKIKKIDGVVFNPLNNTWNIDDDKSVNYIAIFKKN